MWLDIRHKDMYLPGCQCPSNTKQNNLHNGKDRCDEETPLKPGTHSRSAKKQATRNNMTKKIIISRASRAGLRAPFYQEAAKD